MTDKKQKIKQFLKACPYALLLMLICISYWAIKTKTYACTIINTYFVSNEVYTNSEVNVSDDELNSDTGSVDNENDTDVADNSDSVVDTDSVDNIDFGIDGQYEGGVEDRANLTTLPEYNPNIYPYNMGDIVGSYVYYEPVETASKYYTDPGRIALTSLAYYSEVDDSYFEDACFIGDSRMTGIYYYSSWQNSTFLCDDGYSVTGFLNGKSVTCMNTGRKSKLEDALSERTYGKIYIMLGINDCGYGDTAFFKDRYAQMIDAIREIQPDATIYLLANLNIGVQAEKADKTGVYTNINVNDKNVAISELADSDNRIYFLNHNAMFCEDDGYLNAEITFDGYHLFAEYYTMWTDYFKSHAVLE